MSEVVINPYRFGASFPTTPIVWDDLENVTVSGVDNSVTWTGWIGGGYAGYWQYGCASSTKVMTVGNTVNFSSIGRIDISLGIDNIQEPIPNRYNPDFSIMTQTPASGGGYENAVFYSAAGLGSLDVPSDTYSIKYVAEGVGGIEYYKNDSLEHTTTGSPSGDYYVVLNFQGHATQTSGWFGSAILN